MADTYMSLIPGFGSGADQYRKNGQDTSSDQQSQLFKSLLQQTMNQQQAPGMGGIMEKLLGTYMGMGGFGGATTGASSLPGMDAGAMGSMGTFPAVMT